MAKVGLNAGMSENSGVSIYIRGLLANFSLEQKDRLFLLEKLKIYGRPVMVAVLLSKLAQELETFTQ